MMGLTRAQSECLAFLKAGFAANGIAPSFEEIRVGLGYASKSRVHRLITGLVERGAIRRFDRRARAIEFVEVIVCPHCGNTAGSEKCRASAADPTFRNPSSKNRSQAITPLTTRGAST